MPQVVTLEDVQEQTARERHQDTLVWEPVRADLAVTRARGSGVGGSADFHVTVDFEINRAALGGDYWGVETELGSCVDVLVDPKSGQPDW